MSTAASFTPGPWEADYGGTVGHIKSVAEHPHGRTPTVCRYDLTGLSIPKDEQQANARLIAMAPRMYAIICELARVKRAGVGKDLMANAISVIASVDTSRVEADR